MNNTLESARALMASFRALWPARIDLDVAICPPFTLLYPMGREIDGTEITLGAQNVYCESSGAFTGEISPEMLVAAGCSHVIIGHSERRAVFGETGELLRRKVAASIAVGLQVIYCVGETLQQRESKQAQPVVQAQLNEVLDAKTDCGAVTIAYEPVWAIGTGRNATPDQAQEMHRFVRGRLAELFGSLPAETMRILYGGSVKAGNAGELMACADIDGALVGGASLVASEFAGIIQAALAGSQK